MVILQNLISNLRISVCHAKSGKAFLWSRLVPEPGTPCTKLCHTMYQALGHLVPDPGTPCTKLCHTLYQTLRHLVPDPVTPCTRPLDTLYQTLAHLVPDLVTPSTKLYHTLYPTLPVHCELFSKHKMKLVNQ